MGVLNLTPDSFSDGGRFQEMDAALAYAHRLMDEGAAIIDLGGESTRPGASPISPAEEQARIIPVLKALRSEAIKRRVRLSVDTRNAGTMRAALEAGADIINDVSALTHDTASMNVVAASEAQIVLMHMQGAPQTMQQNPHYDNVVEDVYAYLEKRVTACLDAGISRTRLVLDIGIGFGKTPAHNITLLQNLERFRTLHLPLLVGVSRKSFLDALSDHKTAPSERLAASLAAALAAAEGGANILRVHDVKETRDALAVWHGLQSSKSPYYA